MTERKEQTIGGSKISIAGGALTTNNEKEIKIPPEKSVKLTIATIARLKELEKTGYMEIDVELHDALKEGDKIIKREIKGKEIKVAPVPEKRNDKVEIEK